MQHSNKKTAQNCHFAELIKQQAAVYKERTAIRFKDQKSKKWYHISWNKFYDYTRLTSQAMIEFGIQPHDRIGLYSQNMPSYIYTDFGAYSIRAITVPMYATSSPDQVEYIVRDAGIELLFVGEQLQYNNAFKIQQEKGLLKQLVIYDPTVIRNPADKTSIYFEEFIQLGNHTHAETKVKVCSSQAIPEDIATIIYTSGTTGESKGVVLTHANFIEAMRIHDIRIPMINEHDISICFLPLTHIFEKAWTCFCFYKGVQVAINQDPKNIQEALKEVRPTLMCNVPRFWEKVYAGALDKINNSSTLMHKLFNRAIKVGKKYQLDFKRKGIRPPTGLSIKFHLYDKTLFLFLKYALGLEKGRFFPVAGAPLADMITDFFISVNIPIKYGYGLTETTATVCFYPEENYEIGSIGKIMPDVQIKIEPDTNEILIKGKTVMTGYYNKPEETAKSFTEDGYFRTGDAGRLEGDTLYFLERIKDLYKTSNGKYVAPQAIELSLAGSSYIEQCIAIGDQRKFVSALIVPNFTTLANYAEKRGISYTDKNDLISKHEIIRFYQSILEECQIGFASYEKIKKFVLLHEPFTIESGELTNTLKLRRNIINKHYAEQIDNMYLE